MSNAPFQTQMEVIDQFIRHPSVYKCCIDAGGIGRQLAEHFVSKYGSRVEPIFLTNALKGEMVERTKQFIAQKRVSLSRDPVIKADIMSMKRIPSKSGGYTYEGQDGKSHADRFCGLMLALHAASTCIRFKGHYGTQKEDNEKDQQEK